MYEMAMMHSDQNIPVCISFVGFMGSGKSTVGKLVARLLGY